MKSVCCKASVTERMFPGGQCQDTGYDMEPCILYRCAECGTETDEVDIDMTSADVIVLEEMLSVA